MASAPSGTDSKWPDPGRPSIRFNSLSRQPPLPCTRLRGQNAPRIRSPRTDESPEQSAILDRRLAYLTTHGSISYSSSRRKRAFEILIPLKYRVPALKKLYVTTAFALWFAYILTLLPISHVEAADGLVAAYNFDEGTGSSTNDASGNGNTGTILNAFWRSSGKNGKAILFNGTTSRIDVNDSNSLDLTTNMTLEAWVKPTTLPTGFRTILHKERANGDSYALYANHDINRPSGEIHTASGYSEVTGTAKVPVTTWTHLATTYDGTKLRLYVNGVLKRNDK